MSAPTQIGTVTVWGLDGTLLFSGLIAADNILESISLEDDAEELERKDKLGETVGLRVWDPKKRIEVSFYPSKPAGTGAIAGAKTNVVLPTKCAKVEIAGMPGSLFNDTTWLYVKGGRVEGANEQEMKITLPLRKYATDIAATANT